MRFKKAMVVFLSFLILLSLVSCGGDENSLTVRVGLTGTKGNTDPVMVTTQEEKIIVSHLFENLMKLTSDGTATGGQAKSYTCVDNLDGTETYTFTLRSDLHWSSGASVRASDFVYAWQRLVDPETNSPNASLLDMVAGYKTVRETGDVTALQVTAESDTTLTVVLNCHCPYFITGICTNAATMPVYAGAEGSVTNGPYTLTDSSSEKMVMTAAKKYYDSKNIGPDTLEFLFLESEEESVTLFQNGELDFVLGLTDDEIARLGDGYVADSAPTVTTLIVNTMNAKLSQSRILQAMSDSIDRDEIVSEIGNKRYHAAEGLIPYGIVRSAGGSFREFAGAQIVNGDGYEERCKAAMADLLENGYSSDYMGSFNGITLRYEDTPQMGIIAKAIQEDWSSQLGLTVTLNAMTKEDLNSALTTGGFTIALVQVTSDRNDASGYLDMWQSQNSENVIFFNNSAYDMLIRVAAASGSGEARDAYLEDAERLLLEQGNVIPICTDTFTYELNNKLTGLYGDGMGVYYFSKLKIAEG